MDYLDEARKLLGKYYIVKESLACDIAILILEAQKETLKEARN